ncbi:DUF1097 domain-containing protein [Tissierella sp. MB52-C2]|uniref:DUF1097 domain-containing protein n=1 Tax=Tissierella sp. MB52-C2 TaxID=3070999 RepID=UPI00280B946C|nr:DUF1097 domain-containing protein [Tissierella sp. MB52-C2]WMM26088.1 DUF1097 domain-containing protein [Tissierella sp. MB52-C2]
MSAKIIKNISEDLNLHYDEKGKIAYGLYKGYKVVIQEHREERRFYINFPIKLTELSQKEDLERFIGEVLEKEKFVWKAFYEDYCFKIHLVKINKVKKDMPNIIDTLNKVEDFLKSNYYKQCCESCGEDIDTSVYLINKNPLDICEKCYKDIIDTFHDARTNFRNQKSNIVAGIVGAFLGSLLGVILWIVVYAIGYIAAICGIALAVCTLKGYEKLGGKLDKVGIAITTLITIVMVFVANYLSHGYDIYAVFKDTEGINIFEGIRSVRFFLEEVNEFRSSYYENLIKGYLFTAFGAGSMFINTYRTKSFRCKTRKLD